MKIILISLAIVVLIGLFAGLGYFLYHNNQPKEIGSKTNKPNPTLETLNYQIPSGGIDTSFSQIQPAEIASPSKQPTTPQKTSPIPPQSVTVKPAVISQNYINFYQDSINNLNKIPAAMSEIQKTLAALQEKYQNGDTNALLSLISLGVSQNAVLATDASNLKNSLDNWTLANSQTTDAAIKLKTDETIEAGKTFAQSALELSDILGKILNSQDNNEIDQLSQQLQVSMQKINDTGSQSNKLFTELNNLLKNL
ncbi:MAG: hypothetical protein Q8N22_03340 [bacterium]|nr:hypothetical protein [bacterium]